MSLSDQHISRLRQVARAPHILRAMVRGDEIWLTVLAAAVGATAGVCVWIMTRTTFRAHGILFSLPDGVRLSGAAYVLPWRLVAVPVCGGVAVGAFALLVARLLPRRPVDPIEANALHGGRMSVRDSLIVAFQTFLSNGCGGSVGLEAGFSQIAGAFGSWFGRSFRVRREELRVLVGCGAGGAIGAAFGAPIAGAFYAFELVIGTYSAAKIAPVAMAAIGAVGVTHLLGGVTPAAEFPPVAPMDFRSVLPICVLGVGCGLVGIVVMKGVTLTESLFRRVPGPSILRPALGGLLLGGLALGSPSVLSAGHAAMHNILVHNPGVRQVGLLLVLKVLASAVCIGSGFRGGLFFAALYLGVLAGDGLGVVLHGVGLDALSVQACAIVGMNAMAVAIIGGPMTMTCLTLEMTGNPALAGAALLSGILSLVTVRRLFGYSFATWRFHLRGESIRSAVDIGWMRRLTVRRMMTGGIRTMTPETTLARARVLVPPGVAPHIVLADGTRRYYGIVLVAELHNPMHDNAQRLAELAILRRHILLPNMNVRDAVQTFERAEADVLAVVDDDERRMVIGLLSEKHALRRYAEELDRTRRELAGEDRSRTYD